MRWISAKTYSASLNMAIDEALMDRFKRGNPTIIRLYRWERPAVSIGYFQKLKDVVHSLDGRSNYFDFVRRPTGGGAVIHNGNTTFSVVFNREDKPVEEYYRLINEILMKVLSIKQKVSPVEMPIRHCEPEAKQSLNIGIASGFRPRNDNLVNAFVLAKEPSLPIFCHNNITKYDVIIDRKKFAGFALRRSSNAILLQGYLAPEYNKDIEEALILGFKKVLGISPFKDELAKEEYILAHQLQRKYSSYNWNHKR